MCVRVSVCVDVHITKVQRVFVNANGPRGFNARFDPDKSKSSDLLTRLCYDTSPETEPPLLSVSTTTCGRAPGVSERAPGKLVMKSRKLSTHP